MRLSLSVIAQIVLLDVVYLGVCHATIDYCDADPRSRISITQCNTGGHGRLLLHVRKLDGNPYHSLHDSIWPVGHYLSHCKGRFAYGEIDVMTDGAQYWNFSQCRSPNPPSVVYRSPFWGFCAVLALAESVGGKVYGVSMRGLPIGGGCYDKVVTFAVDHVAEEVVGVGKMRNDYRVFSWFGRTCAEGFGGECDEGVQNRSMLVPLTSRLKKEGMGYVRESFMKLQGVVFSADDGDRKVRVLMYDRNDTGRRQWDQDNARKVHGRIMRDDRVEMKFVHRTPSSLRKQVEMYLWADVVLAPHGAGLVNSVFMREGSEIIEARKHCDEWVGRDRFVGSDWTGWHAIYLGINIVYVQCHRVEEEFKERGELLDGQHGPPTNGVHKYQVDEILELLETVLERQVLRLRRMRERAENMKNVQSVERLAQFVKHFDSGVMHGNWASRWSFVVIGPVILTMLLVSMMGRRKKLTGKKGGCSRVVL